MSEGLLSVKSATNKRDAALIFLAQILTLTGGWVKRIENGLGMQITIPPELLADDFAQGERQLFHLSEDNLTALNAAGLTKLGTYQATAPAQNDLDLTIIYEHSYSAILASAWTLIVSDNIPDSEVSAGYNLDTSHPDYENQHLVCINLWGNSFTWRIPCPSKVTMLPMYLGDRDVNPITGSGYLQVLRGKCEEYLALQSPASSC